MTGLAWLTRFRVIEHPPDPVRLSAFDHLHRCRSFKCRVGFLQPVIDLFRLHQACKRIKEPIHFNYSSFCRSRRLLPARPFRHGPGRKPRHTTECFPSNSEPLSYIAYGCSTAMFQCEMLRGKAGSGRSPQCAMFRFLDFHTVNLSLFISPCKHIIIKICIYFCLLFCLLQAQILQLLCLPET